MVVAISMFRDEADVAATVVRHMVGQVDRVLVADNGSTDGTKEIARQAGAIVTDDPDPAYYQSQKMSGLAERARLMGADWIVPFDADEIWTGKRGAIKRTLEALPDFILVAEAALYDYVATGQDNGAPNPFERMRWRRSAPVPLPKVAFRAFTGAVVHQGNHGVTLPDHPIPPIIKHLLTVRHFPYRSPEQFIRKARNGAAAYAATNLPEEVGQHWRGYGRMSDDGLRDHFSRWFWRADPSVPVEIEGEHQPPLVEDPVRLGVV